MGLPAFNKKIAGYLNRELTEKRFKLPHFPYFSSNNHWETIESSGWDDWVGGFWPGILWLASAEDSRWRHLAEKTTYQVIPALKNNFNIGFRNQYSWATGFAGTNNTKMKKEALASADRLVQCFEQQTELIGHRHGKEILVTAADVLMNLPLLYWASTQKPVESRYREAVTKTVDNLSDLLVRQDGSLHHIIKFDLKTGEIVEKTSPQGKENGCWSRGLAWASYGFILGGIVLNREKYFETSKKLLDYHESNTPDTVPPFDYSINLEENPDLTDTSAAAILACGLLLWSKHTRDNQLQKKGGKIVEKLFTKYRQPENKPGLIGGGCFHQPKGAGINAATIWGDYYALEALYLAQKDTLPPQLNWLNKAA